MTVLKTGRKLRADAEKNRQRILDEANKIFAVKGTLASLEEIARTANVGIGTLYRHFPTREHLIDAIYQEQGVRLTLAAQTLGREYTPIEAIRQWMLLYISSLENKQIMAGVLSCLSSSGEQYCSLSGEALITALSGLIEDAECKGFIKHQASATDILCSITGIATYSPDENWEEAAKNLLNIIMLGLVSPQ